MVAHNKIYGFGLAALVAATGLAGVDDLRRHAHDTPAGMTMVDPGKVSFAPAPIPTSWVREGHPKTEAAEIARSQDGTTVVYVWRTTAARFDWFYASDEIVTVLDGEVFVDDRIHGTRRLGPGDVAFFPAGAATTWRVPDHLRKIATLKRPMPGPIVVAQRWLRAAKDWIKPEQAFAGD